MKIGKNVNANVDKNVLTLVIDLSSQGELSKSGKSHVIGTTNGFVDVAPGIQLNLNAIKVVTAASLTPEQALAMMKAKLEKKEARKAEQAAAKV